MKIESQVDAEFIGLPVKKMRTHSMKRKESTIQAETDEEAMARFARENPEYVQYEREC